MAQYIHMMASTLVGLNNVSYLSIFFLKKCLRSEAVRCVLFCKLRFI